LEGELPAGGEPALIVQGAELWTPAPLGPADLLVVAGRIVRIARRIDPRPEFLPAEVLDARGLAAAPGLVDGHVHILGGGGEGGPATRAPEVTPADLVAAGITTVVGLLGFDAVTRSLPGLLAKARALDEAGLTAFVYTGAYEFPVRTLTGDVERDVALVDKVVGCGEVAISDHRSTQPSTRELARLAAAVHNGGVLAGKAGVTHLHVGSGRRGLEPIWRLLAETDLPPGILYPTHVNRSRRLLAEAADLARSGCPVDLTATVAPDAGEPGAVAPEEALGGLLRAGVPPERITLSSDGNGSTPTFDADGNLVSIGVGPVALLWERLRRAVRAFGVPLPLALAAATANPARVLRLRAKGRLAPGADGDVILFDRRLRIRYVVARGRLAFAEGEVRLPEAFRPSVPAAHADSPTDGFPWPAHAHGPAAAPRGSR
jgi:beta-aspartyl-dipeptidase (metallo-type)